MKRMILVVMLLVISSVICALLDVTVNATTVGPPNWAYTVTNEAGSNENCNAVTIVTGAPFGSITGEAAPVNWSVQEVNNGGNANVVWTADSAGDAITPGNSLVGFGFSCTFGNNPNSPWNATGSDGGSDTGTTDAPLPVELSSFTVSFTAGQQAEVCWVTQSETGNMGWNVYRSQTDDFAEAMVLNAAMIGGAGTVSSPTNYSFIDEAQLIEEFTYWYWIESIDYSGETTSYDPVQFTVPQDPGQQPQPPVYHNALYQNYPNPFNPSTMIAYSLEVPSDVKISIFNQRGEHVKTFMVHNAPEGDNGVEWNGTNEAGNLVSSGIYFYTIEANKFRATRKALLIK